MARARTQQASVVAAASVRSVKHGTSRALTYLPPWLMWLSLPVFALVFWLMAMPGKVAAMLVAGALVASTAGLTWFTWHVYGRREPSVRIHATVFVAGCGLWVYLASTFDLFVRPDVDVWPQVWRIFEWLIAAFNWWVWSVWLVAGVVGCLTWSIRRASAPPEGQQPTEDSKLAKLLAGARLHAKQIDGRVVGEITANRGEQTIKDLQGLAEPLESLHGLRRGAVRISGTDDHGKGELVITPDDPLKVPIPWPGPSAPGKSIADVPIPIGVYEDGEVASIWLCGDDEAGRALAHWLVMGINGAGKSQGWAVAMADALTRHDFELWGSDHVKGKQTFGPLIDRMGRVATTLKAAKQLIAEARDEAARRQADFGERGIKQWEKGCGYPLTLVWIEEASEVVSDSVSFIRLVERVRSAGIVVVASLQLAKHDNIDTSARAQLAAALCFGVRDGADASYALPDTVLDAGAAPDAWGNRKPGYCYLVAPGVSEERWAVPLRTYRGHDPQIVAALQKAGAPVAKKLNQPNLDNPVEALAYLVKEGVINVDDDTRDTLMAARRGAGQDPDEDDGMEPMPPDLDRTLPVNPDRPIPPPPAGANLPFANTQPERRLSTDEARAVVQQHLRTLLGQGRTHTQPADVCGMKPETTRTREWVRQEMARLCAEPGEGEIGLERDNADVPGVYRIVAPVTAGV